MSRTGYNPTMATVTKTEKQHITRVPGICGGKPCVAGTRVRVWDVYVLHELRGATPAEIVAEFPSLTLADVHAALAYFWDNEAEIREQARADDLALESARRSAGPSPLDEFRSGVGPNEDQVPSR